MRRQLDLEYRLTQWGREYGGGKYEDIGWQGLSPLAVMMRYQGRSPQGLNPRSTKDRTPADEVQDAIQKLSDSSGGYGLAHIIRCEYLTPGLANESRRQRLAELGHRVGKTAYYEQLNRAKDFIAEELGFSSVMVA